MPTYHGITKAICLNCGKITLDDLALEILNDLDPVCRDCNFHAVAWHLKDGIVITAQKTIDEDSDIERLAILEKGAK
jgi:DNA-directed RNA polymerase subunit RPC12/RpoP